MQVGVKGFLSKDCTKEELQTAIQVLSQGAGYFSSIISEILLRPKASNDRTSDKTFKKLTVREREVLECIANEYTNKEIAGRLFISQRTVETHRRNLIQKLKVKNTVGLVKYYFQAYGNLSNNKVGIST
ncbi:MAG TPA: response regulator transcription factor [Phaeodactylibacter sp.]|nr:response regulator transcription factor [Phaeodactylibacter sp.]